ncbi:MAG: DUF2237 domain-containing protein [Salinibacter sp.]
MEDVQAKNVLGGDLQACSTDPMTGFYRDGCCNTGPRDLGTHVVCAEMTEAFLAYTAEQGNDLVTPRPEMNFPGLKPGDRWCLCVNRWTEAAQAGVAPPVILEATNEAALDVVSLDILKAHAVDTDPSEDAPRPDDNVTNGDV